MGVLVNSYRYVTGGGGSLIRTFLARADMTTAATTRTVAVSGLTTGDLLVVFGGAGNPSFNSDSMVLTASDTLGGLSWTKVESEGVVTGFSLRFSTSVHYATVGGTTSGNITLTCGSSANIFIEAHKFSGWSSVGGTVTGSIDNLGVGEYNYDYTLSAAPASSDIVMGVGHGSHSAPTTPDGSQWSSATEIYEGFYNVGGLTGAGWQTKETTGGTSTTVRFTNNVGASWYNVRAAAIVVKA